MPGSWSRPRPVVLLVAILVPLLVVWTGLSALRRPAEMTGQASSFDRQLAQHEPDVVIFGSSLANRGVDLAVVARSLGIPEQKILLMQLPHSSIAHWYALLKNRVYRNGHRPKLVLVVDAFTSMLNHDLLQMQPNVDRLVAQLTNDEPVLAQKVFRIDDPDQFRSYFLRERASEVRQAYVEGWRDLALGALFGKKAGRTEDGENKLVEKVNEVVFSNENMDYASYGLGKTAAAFTPSSIPFTENGSFELRRDALLADMSAIAREHDTNLVYVRIPLPPSNADMDFVPTEIEADATAWIDDLGDVYLDMRALDLDDSYFEDMRHLSNQGSQIFSAALGRVLAAMRALEPGAGRRAVRGLEEPSAIDVIGAPPTAPELPGAGSCERVVEAGALAALDVATFDGLGGPPSPLTVSVDGQPLRWGRATTPCAGSAWIEGGRLHVSAPTPDAVATASLAWQVADPADPEGHGARWIAPGTSVEYTFAEPWSLPEQAFRVYVRGYAFGEQERLVTVHVGEEQFTLANRAGRLSGVGKLAAPTQGGWKLRVSTPADGPWVMLHHLAIGAPPSTAFVLGKAESLHGMSVRVVGGRVEDTQHKAVYASEPTAMPFQPRVRRGARGTGIMQVDKLVDLADSEQREDAKPNKCSPVWVLEDGQPLANPHAACAEVAVKGEGRFCFAGDYIQFASSDGTDPLTNGRAYTLALSPRRICDVMAQKGAAFLRDSWWLYPTDQATWTAGAEEMDALRDGANVLEVEAIAFVNPLDAPLKVELVQGDRVVLERTWLPEDTQHRRRTTFAIDPPLPPRSGAVSVRITNPSTKGFALITSITIAEDYDMFSAEVTDAPPPGTASREVDAPVTRSGDGVALPEPKKGPATTFGAFEAKVFPVWPVSDSYLEEKLDLPPASPVRLFIDGAPLVHEHDRKAFRAGCDRCYYHSGQSLMFYAEGANKGSAVKVDLDPAVPMLLADGTPIFWIYPGTALTFTVPGGFRGSKGKVVAEGVAMHAQKEQAGAGVFLEVGEAAVPFTRSRGESAFHASTRVNGDGTITVRSEQGSYLLLRGLRIEDPDGTTWLVRLGRSGQGGAEPPPAAAPAE